MGYTIPNLADAFAPAQAAPDSVDFAILAAGVAGTGVVSGCAVSAQVTPDMTVSVASGSVLVGWAGALVTGGTLTISTAHATLDRFDLIVASNTGAISVVAGAATTNPVFPAIPANSAVLAAVYVAAGATAIQSNRIVDKRVILASGDDALAYLYF